MEKNNNAYWVGKEILKSGMTMGEPAKTDPEQIALLPIDPKREALAQTCRILGEYRRKNELRKRYQAYPEQITTIEQHFDDIIFDLEYQIVEIDKTSK